MKYVIASDIHGSAKFCEKLLDRYELENADRLVLLGDLLYHGPRNDLPEGYDPKKVVSLLNSVKNEILCVRGNCEAEVDQMMLDFPVLADYALVETDGLTLFVTHGHLFGKDNPPPLKKGDILLCGHTHVPACESLESFTYINPGSVSIPKDCSHRGYVVLENGIFVWKTLDGKIVKSFSPLGDNITHK